MCGISVIWNRDGSLCLRKNILAMRDMMVHRGPDDAGIYIDGAIGLGFRRLSILDLTTAGNQPMCNEDGTVWIIYNGEIFNYIEIASTLRSRGHSFRSSTDTEVIIHLYEDEGIKCLNSLNGMFAFVIWDSRKKILFAARDRIGIKPLYFYSTDSLFACASEIKGLLAHPDIQTALNYQGLADYFFVGAPLAKKTLFKNIAQLPPAHMLILNESGISINRYWDVDYRYQYRRTRKKTINDLSDLMDDAIRIHCRSDVEIGCHLSGGLDSSIVSRIASQHRLLNNAFSVRFRDSSYYDETEYASEVASGINAHHYIIEPKHTDLKKLLGNLTWHQDFPQISTGGFGYFSVSRLAAAYVKVVLTGHGGDEIFGGYPPQFQLAFGSTDMFDFSLRPEIMPINIIKRILRVLKRRGFRDLSRRILRMNNGKKTPESEWFRLHCINNSLTSSIFHPKLSKKIGPYSPIIDYLAPFTNAPTDQLFDRCLYHDLVTYLPTLLMKEDRASMAVSIESRVPLLDYRIVEFMATVPVEEKVKGLIPKSILRDIANKHLPPHIVNRNDKTPFPIPLREWISGPLRKKANEILTSEKSLDRGIFNPRALNDPWLTPWEILQMLNVEIWFRVFIDQDLDWLPESANESRVAFANLPALPPIS